MKPHRHAELIKAWADGAEIQVYKPHWDEWHDCQTPIWDANEYRLKPEPKPNFYRYFVYLNDRPCIYPHSKEFAANLRLFFNGETGELISAEVLK